MRVRDIRDAISVLWPIPVTAAVVPISLGYDLPWVGVLVLIAVMLAHPFWWSCLVGLPVFLTIAMGILICAIETIRDALVG